MARADLDKGIAFFNAGQYAAAVAAFEKCDYPQAALFLRHAREALAGVEPGPPQEVVDVFTAVAVGDPDALGDAARRLFRRDPVLAARVMRDLWIARKDDAFTRGAAAASRSPWALFVRASIAWNAGRNEEALALVRRAARSKETAWMNHYSAEILARRLNRFKDALNAAERAVRQAPRFWEARFFRAELLWATGGRPKKILAALPAPHKPARAWRGALKLWMGFPKEALVDLDAAVGPEHHDAYCWRGGARALLGRLDEALTDLNLVLSRDTDDHEALIWRGEVLRRLGRTEEALRDLNRALDLSADAPWARVNRALIELERGKPKDARSKEELEALLNAARGVRRNDAHLNRALL